MRFDVVARSRSVFAFSLALACLSVGCVESHVPEFEPTPDPSPAVEESSLPVIRITTEDGAPIESRDEYLKGQVTIQESLATDAPVLHDVATEIKGRGNTTWGQPKKPYRLKLASKTALLGMPASKDWALLANYSDRSLMRTSLAFDLSERLGLAWTPRTRFVELVLNEEYVGVYLLTEHIKIAKERVNVRELSEKDLEGENLTGGYLLELDARRDEVFTFDTARGVPFTLKSDVVPAQVDYIQGYVQAAEDAIFADNFADPAEGYAKYLDVDSVIGWYLVNEFAKNVDAAWFSSIYFYKDRNGKLFMGPVWDFDRAFGNVDEPSPSPEGFHVREAPWISRLLEDPAFEAKVRERWATVQGAPMEALLGKIDAFQAELGGAVERNFEAWPILDRHVSPSPYIPGSYDEELKYVREWVKGRAAWMDGVFGRR